KKMALSKEKNEKKKSIAERLYINDGEDCEEISKFVGVTVRTVRRWADNGDWKKQRELFLASPHKIKGYMDKIILDVMEGKEDPNIAKKADAIAKMVLSREKVDTRITVHTVISTFKEFNLFLSQIAPDIAKSITEYQYLFIQQKGDQEIK
uniref:hypothetical protein n=1 Tax=Flammeovirga sp. OC4 TaxID=1382345 RepID=UPI001C124101